MKFKSILLLTAFFQLYAINSSSAIDVMLDTKNPYKNIQIKFQSRGIGKETNPKTKQYNEWEESLTFFDYEHQDNSLQPAFMNLLDITINLIDPINKSETILIQKSYDPSKKLLPIEIKSEESFLMDKKLIKIAYEIKVEFTQFEGQQLVKSILTKILKASMNGTELEKKPAVNITNCKSCSQTIQ